MEALFLKILNLSFQGSWIILAVVLWRLIFRKSPKYIRGILWAVVALRLIFPFSVESIVSLMPAKEVIPQTIVYDAEPQIHSGFQSVDIFINPIITETFAPNPINSANPLQVVNFVLAWLWIIGIAVFLIYGAVNYILLYKRVSVSQNIGEGIYICDKIRTPFILGIIKPKIYLPSDIKDSEKGYVIAHERAHLKRLDHIFKPLGFLILTVYWFNPIIWIGYILFCRDMELACDEKVVKSLTAEEKKSYSETLLSFGLSDGIAKTFSPAFGEIGIRARIKTVLNYKKPAFWVIIVTLLLTAALAVAFLTDPISQKEETPGDTSSSVDSNRIDRIIPYKENWQEDYFLESGNKGIMALAESGRNKNIKAYIANYTNLYRTLNYLIFEDGERVVMRNLYQYGSINTSIENIYLRDLDGDQIDEIIVPNLAIFEDKYYTLVYKITESGFEEFLNVKDLSDYGYYLVPNNYGTYVNIKNKYTNGAEGFSGLSANNEYFYDENGKFKTDITLEYSDIQGTAFNDVNGDGVFEILIDRYVVVKGCREAVLTRTAFGYNGEKFIVVAAEYEYYNKEKIIRDYHSLGRSLVKAELPAFEKGDSVPAEQFLVWFILNELKDGDYNITPYYKPYQNDILGYGVSYTIPKDFVKAVLKENFSVEFSNKSTKYDYENDSYDLLVNTYGAQRTIDLKSLERNGDILVIKYKILSTEEIYDGESYGVGVEIGEMEIGIDQNGNGKIVYYRPNYY